MLWLTKECRNSHDLLPIPGSFIIGMTTKTTLILHSPLRTELNFMARLSACSNTKFNRNTVELQKIRSGLPARMSVKRHETCPFRDLLSQLVYIDYKSQYRKIQETGWK